MQNKLTSTCQYESLLFPDKTCLHPPLKGDRDNFCIFHSRNDKKDKKDFWKGIQAKLEAKDFDFTAYYFPPGLKADFRGKKFKDARFVEVIFKGYVNFIEAEFSGKSTDFGLAKFSGESTDFRLAEFSGESTVFIGVEFSGKSTDFRWAEFSGKSTDLSWAEFSGKSTVFAGAKFSGNTNFGNAEFSGKSTNFRLAEFLGESTVFSGAKFSGENTDFSWAEFSGEGTKFNSADFSGCGTVHFVDTVFKGECGFLVTNFPLRLDQFVIFRGTRDPIDLSKTVFLYCNNYDRVLFRNCRFNEEPYKLFGWEFPLWKKRKIVLCDESYVGKLLELARQKGEEPSPGESRPNPEAKSERVKVEFSHVESLYRQFKKNLEAEKDWELAGEFHYGEMECKRKGLESGIRQNLGLLAWYKYFSGYGERPFRASCWIVFLLLAFAGIYWFLDTLPRQGFGYYLWELSVKTAFLQRIGETGNEPIGLLGKFFYLLQSVLCPTLIALFILALRRRVRR